MTGTEVNSASWRDLESTLGENGYSPKCLEEEVVLEVGSGASKTMPPGEAL